MNNEYGKLNVSFDDDGDMLLNPHDMEWFKEAEATETPGKNLRFYDKQPGKPTCFSRWMKGWKTQSSPCYVLV